MFEILQHVAQTHLTEGWKWYVQWEDYARSTILTDSPCLSIVLRARLILFGCIFKGSAKSVLSHRRPRHCPSISLMPFCLKVPENVAICLPLFNLTWSVVALDPKTTASMFNNTQDPNLKQGWTPQPEGRGTLNVLWSCLITMVLCSWSTLCMNMPGPSESRTQILRRKLALTALGFLCPEMIFEIALGQWLSARQSVTDFDSSGFGNRSIKGGWTMKEAFFTDMGGFILHTRDQLPFPPDAKQLHYLVSRQYLKLPILDHRELEDKNKVDGFLRAITLCQITWFVINTVGRWAQHLVVTTAELTTVSFGLCTLMNSFCWWHKPADAILAEVIESDITINDILKAEGQAPDVWKRTPLDFVNRNEWWWSRCWANFLNILRKMHLTYGSDVTPIDRIADSLQKELPMKSEVLYIGMAFTSGCFAVLFMGWNYNSPTRTEQILWRAACVTMLAMLLILFFCAQLVGTYSALRRTFRRRSASNPFRTNGIESGYQPKMSTKSKNMRKRLNIALDGVRNNSVDRDPLLHVPLKIMIPIYIIATLYCHARTYILIADIIEQRSLPASAYMAVDWAKLWPHFGYCLA